MQAKPPPACHANLMAEWGGGMWESQGLGRGGVGEAD